MPDSKFKRNDGEEQLAYAKRIGLVDDAYNEELTSQVKTALIQINSALQYANNDESADEQIEGLIEKASIKKPTPPNKPPKNPAQKYAIDSVVYLKNGEISDKETPGATQLKVSSYNSEKDTYTLKNLDGTPYDPSGLGKKPKASTKLEIGSPVYWDLTENKFLLANPPKNPATYIVTEVKKDTVKVNSLPKCLTVYAKPDGSPTTDITEAAGYIPATVPIKPVRRCIVTIKPNSTEIVKCEPEDNGQELKENQYRIQETRHEKYILEDGDGNRLTERVRTDGKSQEEILASVHAANQRAAELLGQTQATAIKQEYVVGAFGKMERGVFVFTTEQEATHKICRLPREPNSLELWVKPIDGKEDEMLAHKNVYAAGAKGKVVHNKFELDYDNPEYEVAQLGVGILHLKELSSNKKYAVEPKSTEPSRMPVTQPQKTEDEIIDEFNTQLEILELLDMSSIPNPTEMRKIVVEQIGKSILALFWEIHSDEKTDAREAIKNKFLTLLRQGAADPSLSELKERMQKCIDDFESTELHVSFDSKVNKALEIIAIIKKEPPANVSHEEKDKEFTYTEPQPRNPVNPQPGEFAYENPKQQKVLCFEVRASNSETHLKDRVLNLFAKSGNKLSAMAQTQQGLGNAEQISKFLQKKNEERFGAVKEYKDTKTHYSRGLQEQHARAYNELYSNKYKCSATRTENEITVTTTDTEANVTHTTNFHHDSKGNCDLIQVRAYNPKDERESVNTIDEVRGAFGGIKDVERIRVFLEPQFDATSEDVKTILDGAIAVLISGETKIPFFDDDVFKSIEEVKNGTLIVGDDTEEQNMYKEFAMHVVRYGNNDKKKMNDTERADLRKEFSVFMKNTWAPLQNLSEEAKTEYFTRVDKRQQQGLGA